MTKSFSSCARASTSPAFYYDLHSRIHLLALCFASNVGMHLFRRMLLGRAHLCTQLLSCWHTPPLPLPAVSYLNGKSLNCLSRESVTRASPDNIQDMWRMLIVLH